jgi:hypothetical protein
LQPNEVKKIEVITMTAEMESHVTWFCVIAETTIGLTTPANVPNVIVMPTRTLA